MKFFLRCTLLVMLLLAAERRAGAQTFTLFATNTASTLETSNFLTYDIIVTNITGTSLANVTVTNLLPPTVAVSSVNSSIGVFTNYNNGTNAIMIFSLGTLADGLIEQMSLTVIPTAAGQITNNIQLYTPTPILPTNYVSTNLVTTVTNPVINADLGVSMTGPAQAVIVGDFMAYGVTVTNLGPSSAPGVLVTNLLPGGVLLVSASPTNLPVGLFPVSTNANNTATNIVFDVGTLADGGSIQFSFTLMPTNATTNLTLTAAVGAPGVTDLDPTNDTAATNIVVYNYLTNGLESTLFTNTSPLDPVTGFIEQSVLVFNTNAIPIPGFRVVVTGVSNQLYNASGTNFFYPFVDYSTPLPAGRAASVLLQFVRSSVVSTNEQAFVSSLPVTPVWPAPPASTFATNVLVTKVQPLNNQWMSGAIVLEFPSYTNRTYTVVYSDNIFFSNAQVVVPPIVSQANQILWVDYGPPGTTNRPALASPRYYQVYLNNTNNP